jgi:polyribonucleotide nucleotidyltransferase
MDFKVTGTADGITATQMDIKVDGLSYEVLSQALQQAKKGRLHILGKMMETIDRPRPDLKPHVPRIEQISIPTDTIGAVIGPGGKVIQEIQKLTGTTITITERDNKGIVDVFGESKEAIEEAIARVKAIAIGPEVGEIYTGKVRAIHPYGAFIEILPGKDGLLHISEIEWQHLEKVEDVLAEGDIVEVKLLEIDEKTGKLKLSRRALMPKPDSYVEPAKNDRDRDRRPQRGNRDNGYNRNRR